MLVRQLDAAAVKKRISYNRGNIPQKLCSHDGKPQGLQKSDASAAFGCQMHQSSLALGHGFSNRAASSFFFFLGTCQPQFTGGSDKVEVCAMRDSDASLKLYLIKDGLHHGYPW